MTSRGSRLMPVHVDVSSLSVLVMSTCIVIATNKSKHNVAMVEEQPNMHGKDELSDDELQAINGGACVIPD